MIAGGGNVGTILAAKLSEKFSTKIIEKESVKIEILISETLEGVVVLNDDISDESLLRE